MKFIFLLCLLFASCSTIPPIRIGWNTKAAQIALHCPRTKPGECQKYADELSAELTCAGILNHVSGYAYTASPDHPTWRGRTHLQKVGNHAVVVFYDVDEHGNGRWEMMDNQHRWPTWIHDDNFSSIQGALGADYVLTEQMVEDTPHNDF